MKRQANSSKARRRNKMMIGAYLDEDTHRRLKHYAKTNRRSVSQSAVIFIERGLAEEGGGGQKYQKR